MAALAFPSDQLHLLGVTTLPSPRLVAALADRYAIERQIGQGGMATVYVARDLRHDRLVALKVLRPELAAVIGAERFLAEIKTTANLQHPHILPLHDSGEADGTVFYVMPFVEGETLRDRIAHEKQLPVDEAVSIAVAIAGALDYAHRHGVVHRDIKPENILLHDGQALVADFGISLAVSRADGGTRMTETGLSLGTPHYMAPEQAMGQREITAKADIYALGCVLYEMLTGEPPFTGTTAQAIVARAVTESPRGITIQRHTVPAHVEATTLKALEKLPADRFASAAEFAAALGNPALTTSAQLAGANAGRGGRDWRTRAAVPLVGVSMIALAAFVWAATRPVSEAPPARYALAFAAGTPPATGALHLSPDGDYLAYGMGDVNAGTQQIWIKARGRESPRLAVVARNPGEFTFSPDGQWLAFVLLGGEVRKVPVLGGPSVPVATVAGAPSNGGLAWLDDGTIVIVGTGGRSLVRVAESGGTPKVIWGADSATSGVVVGNPVALPGSTGLLFTRCPDEECEIRALDLRSGLDTVVAPQAFISSYSSTGHLVFITTERTLSAVRFDARTLRARGEAVQLLDSLAAFALASDGTLVTRRGELVGPSPYELVWVDRGGSEIPVDSAFRFRNTVFGANVAWALSPDGRRLAIGLNSATGDNLWVKQLPTGPASRVTLDTFPSFRPRWSRDGRTLDFMSRRSGGVARLYRRAADGTGDDTLVYEVKNSVGIYEAAWSADLRTLILRAGGTVNTVGGRDILVAVPGVDSVPRPLVATAEFDESGIALSPDGRWLAYESNETGKVEVYLRPFPAVNSGKWQVSVDGGRAPLWARNGRELFYVNGRRAMVAVPVAASAGATPQLGTSKQLFTLRPEIYLANQENYTPFDIAPDGRFMMARRVGNTDEAVAPLVVTVNWFAELRQAMGGR